MDHGSEAARTATVGSADLAMAMAGAVRGSEANIGSAAVPGSFSAVAGRGVVPVAGAAEFHLHHEPVPGGVAYPNIGAGWRQLGPVDVVLVGSQLPGGVVPVHDSYGYSALQPRPGAGRAVVLAPLQPGGALYTGDYALQPRPGAGDGEVLVDLLVDGAGHGQVFVSLFPGGVDAAYDNHGYYALLPRPGAGHGEALVDLLPDGARHGEVFVGLLPGGGVAAHDDYGYYPWQPRLGVGSGEVFIGPFADGVSVVFDDLGDFAQQTLRGTGRADRITGALRDPNLGAGYDSSGALADDLGAVYDNRGMVSEHLRRLLPLAGIGASSVAINGLAAGPGSPAVAFQLFVLLLGGLFLVILHVLRV